MGRKFINLIGQKFNKLTPIEYKGKNRYLCKCDCGNKKIILACNFKSGQTKSCGCLYKETKNIINLKHGHSIGKNTSRTYNTWHGMVQRCTNINDKDYKHYGGRTPPITLCDRWNPKKGGSFENFLEDMGECPPGLTLDRIKNELGYFKENCRWTTYKKQARNRRNNHLIPFNGKKLCFAEWEEITGIPQKTIRTRIKKGMSTEEALTIPVKKRNNNAKKNYKVIL